MSPLYRDLKQGMIIDDGISDPKPEPLYPEPTDGSPMPYPQPGGDPVVSEPEPSNVPEPLSPKLDGPTDFVGNVPDDLAPDTEPVNVTASPTVLFSQDVGNTPDEDEPEPEMSEPPRHPITGEPLSAVGYTSPEYRQGSPEAGGTVAFNGQIGKVEPGDIIVTHPDQIPQKFSYMRIAFPSVGFYVVSADGETFRTRMPAVSGSFKTATAGLIERIAPQVYNAFIAAWFGGNHGTLRSENWATFLSSEGEAFYYGLLENKPKDKNVIYDPENERIIFEPVEDGQVPNDNVPPEHQPPTTPKEVTVGPQRPTNGSPSTTIDPNTLEPTDIGGAPRLGIGDLIPDNETTRAVREAVSSPLVLILGGVALFLALTR